MLIGKFLPKAKIGDKITIIGFDTMKTQVSGVTLDWYKPYAEKSFIVKNVINVDNDSSLYHYYVEEEKDVFFICADIAKVNDNNRPFNLHNTPEVIKNRLIDVVELLSAVEDKQGNYYRVQYTMLDDEHIGTLNERDDEVQIGFDELIEDNYTLYRQIEVTLY